MSANSKWIEGLGPECSVAQAARRSLEPRLTAVTQALPMAAHLAAHDVEYVHRLRVATRRASAALKLYRDCVGDKPAQWMKKWLRKIRHAAGAARDLDVLADRLAHDYGEPVAPIIDLIAKDRETVQPAILEVAEQCRHEDRFVRKTAKVLKSIGKLKNKDSPNSELFRDWAKTEFASVADQFAIAMPNGSSVPEELHQFRIRAKALRYAIELVAPAFGPDLREETYPIIEELQERLGKVQDHVAAIDRCQIWSETTRSTLLRTRLDELMSAEDRGLADSIREFRGWWTDERAANVCSQLNVQAAARHTNAGETSDKLGSVSSSSMRRVREG
jgi:CHAD domain-containing protein